MWQKLIMFSLLISSLPLFAVQAQDSVEQGERLFISKGCLGCHGASGRGGVGPDIAQTSLTPDAFLQQVRNPREMMPPFPEASVSESQVRLIYTYMQQVPPPAARLRQELPTGVVSADSCAPCHMDYHPTIVRQFHGSAMGKEGEQNPTVEWEPDEQILCTDCHGDNHDIIMASKGRVSEMTCGRCHMTIYKEHVAEGGHSYGPGPGNIGLNWERNIQVPHYEQMPRKVMEMGCDPCHAVAEASNPRYWDEQKMQYTDGSSLQYRNGCISCHTRHSFNLAEARKPEACYACHMGPDHPNYEAYMSSKHGALYATKGDQWDWTQSITEMAWDAPTCAYCHMLYVDDDGTRRSSHNMRHKIIWGMGTQPAGDQLTDITVQPENQQKRNEMVKACLQCHSENKARGYLKSADAHKLAGDALVIDARNILAGLYEDGLIEPSHGRQSAGLLQGPEFTAIELPSQFAMHWPAGLYYDVTQIEKEYFDMFFFSNLKSYKGAFHMSPDYSWWKGYAETLGHLASIRDEAENLREADRTRTRTLFMIFTGPLMVLAVLLGIYLLWRWYRKTYA